jgi:hypothetical protein
LSFLNSLFFLFLADLRGSLYIAALPYVFPPTLPPTQPPSGSANIQSAGVIGDLSAGVVAAIFIAAFIILGACAIVIYFCCCRSSSEAALLTKKKKEEEDSPYTVHSYMGYADPNDNAHPASRPPVCPYLPHHPQSMMGMGGGAGGAGMDPALNKKGDLDKKGEKALDKADPAFIRKMFPYKVYSYRGYQGEGAENSHLPSVKEEDGEHGGDSEESNHQLYMQQQIPFSQQQQPYYPPLQQQQQYYPPLPPHMQQPYYPQHQQYPPQFPPAQYEQHQYAPVNYNNYPTKQPVPLQTASMDMDVVMTEPMRLAALKENNLSSDSMDPEARNDLARQDEVDRFKYVEAARNHGDAQYRTMDDEALRAQESNRVKEEARVRNEERIRAGYALFKSKAEENMKKSSSQD